MVLNRKTDRRRRLLVDSNSLVGETGEVNTKNKKRSKKKEPAQTDVRKAYAVGAKRRHQRKVTDLIPKRRLAYSLTLATFAVLLAGVNLLAYFAPSWQAVIGRQGLETLSVTGSSSLTTYLSTICFAVASALCFQIYALRQHRCDDYEGSYRVWGWLAPAFMIASLGAFMPLAAISQNIFTALSGRGFTVTWLPIAIGIGFVSLFLIRYLMEVRYSYGTVAWAVLAWFGICTGWAMPEILSAFSPNVDQDLINDLAMGNGLLLAAAGSLLANLTYARFVFLRSNGFIHAQPKQIKSKAAFPFRPLRKRGAARPTRAERKAAAVAKKEATADDQSVKRSQKVSHKAVAESQKIKTKKAKAGESTKASESTKPSRSAKSKPAATPRPVAPSEPVAPPESVVATEPVATPKPASQPPKAEAPVPVAQPEAPAKEVSLSASEKLRQLAAATRIQKTPDQMSDQDAPATVKMSKAQRRKLRKQQKKQNRAA